MSLPDVVSRADWLAARKELLVAEKRATRARDELNAAGTTFAAVSRAPLAKITPYKQRMGWTFPWYSSSGSDFNYDFHVTLDESVAPVEYNYRTRAEQEREGSPRARYFDGEQPIELPGVSCFLRDGDRVFHTYSAYGRGTDNLGLAVNLLDLTALGRQ